MGCEEDGVQFLIYARHSGQLPPHPIEQPSWEGTGHAVSAKGVGIMQRMLSWDPDHWCQTEDSAGQMKAGTDEGVG